MMFRLQSFRALRPAVAVVALLSSPVLAQDPTALKERARALAKQGDYAQAIKAYDAAVAAATRAYGPNDQRTDIVVNELASAHYNQGNYAEVEPLFLRVLRNTEARSQFNTESKAGWDKYYEVGTCLNNLGALYDEMGDYARAEEMYLRALTLHEASVGKNSHHLGTNYTNLAIVAQNQGDTVRAIELFRHSVRLLESDPMRDNAKIAVSLNGLAEAHESLGQSDQAETLYLKSLKLREATLGADHPTLALTLNNLAGLYKRQKNYAQAESLYQRSLRIRQVKLGADHPSTATALSNLATLYREQGRYEDADRLQRQVLTIREAKLPPDHPSLAITLNNLAGLAMDLGRSDQTEELYQRSLKIRLAKNSAEHPDVAQTYNNFGFFHAKVGQWADAASEFDRSRRIVRRHVSQILPALSEADQLTFLKVNDESRLHLAMSLALLRREDAAIAELSAGWVLNSKGIAQQSVAQRMMLNLDLGDPTIGPSVKKLQEARRELSRLTGSATKGDDATRRQRIERLREQERQIAAEVARLSGRPVQNSQWVELADIRRSLPSQSVLVEMARFRVRNFAARQADPDKWQPPRYAAWIIPAADEGPVRLIDLGPAEAIERDVLLARQALVAALELIRSDGEPEAEDLLRGVMNNLSQTVLNPILAQTGEADTLIVSPDAALWLIPWGALPLADKRYAIEKYNLSYVVSGRDVIRHDVEPRLGAPVVLADPDYDLPAAEVVAATKALSRGQAPARSAMKVRPAVEMSPVPRLPGTAAEARAILPKLESYSGKTPQQHLAKDALEVVAKSVKQPQVLVLSTHGFFRPDQEADNTDDGGDGSSLRRGKAPDNPLLRCGLLLAGCNSRQLASLPDADDGVLTGLEVAGIDLRGTELVVLSACETGLGEVRNGEGVAGLRQAFQLAGSRSVMATLWEIPDAQTARLMTDFFGQLSAGKSQAEALRQAQLTMIESRRNRSDAAHPFFWAAITLTGTP